jgi:cytochrome c-type biogenesis protein
LGYLGTLVVGIAFGAGWSPCIGPILGSILTYAATQEKLSRGVILLGAYSLGLAIPFLTAAVAIEWFMRAFGAIKRQMLWINRASGLVLVVIAVLMMTDYLRVITNVLQSWTPAALRNLL